MSRTLAAFPESDFHDFSALPMAEVVLDEIHRSSSSVRVPLVWTDALAGFTIKSKLAKPPNWKGQNSKALPVKVPVAEPLPAI